jgi:hypothetical protein
VVVARHSGEPQIVGPTCGSSHFPLYAGHALGHDDVVTQRSLPEHRPRAMSESSEPSDLTPYELHVLRSHRLHPRRESELVERQTAQKKLSRLGFIRLEAGTYRITPEGQRRLETP